MENYTDAELEKMFREVYDKQGYHGEDVKRISGDEFAGEIEANGVICEFDEATTSFRLA